jgi:hypothetical protein
MTGTNDIMGELDTYNLLNNDHNESVYSIPMSKIDTQSNSLIDLTKPIAIKKRSIDFTNNNNNNNQSNAEINSEDKINELTNAKKQKITKVSLLSEDGPTSLKPDENKGISTNTNINKNDSKNQKINTVDIEQIKNTSYFIDKYKNITAPLNTKNSNAFFYKTMINFNFSDLLSTSNYLSDYKIVIADSNPMKKSIVLICHKLILAFSSGFFNTRFYADHVTEKSCHRNNNTVSQIIMHRNTDTITIYASEFYNCSVDDLAFMIRFLYNPNIHELSKLCSSFFDIIKIHELGTYFDIQQYKILAQVRIYKILDTKNVFLFFSNLIQSKKYEQHRVLITHCECFMAINNGEEYTKKILDTVRNTDNKEIQERLSKSMLNITNYEKEYKISDQEKKCLEFFGLKYFISYELYVYIKSNMPSLLNNK